MSPHKFEIFLRFPNFLRSEALNCLVTHEAACIHTRLVACYWLKAQSCKLRNYQQMIA